MSPDPVTVQLDVSAPAGLGSTQSVAGWVLVPREDRQPPSTAVVCLHGGTYDKRYWNPEVPDAPSYSMARHFVDRGLVVVAVDHLGMGASTRPGRVDDLTPEVVARANDAAAREVLARLTSGTLAPGIGPRRIRSRLVGIGHSMGGMLALIQQGAHATFDRLAVLGWSARSTNVDRRPDDFTEQGDYRLIDRSVTGHLFHWEDVPDAVVAADNAATVATPRTLEDAAFVPGITSEPAAQIDVPVFIGLGERDISPDPWSEPAQYRSSSDITLYVLQRSGHCHNFAGSRRLLWNRLAAWSTNGLAGMS